MITTSLKRLNLSTSLTRPLSLWANIAQAPPDKILGLTEAFKADKYEKKINLGVGAYRDDQGRPYVLPSVKAAEDRILARNLDKEYAPIAGYAPFIQKSIEFAYGVHSEAVQSGRIAAVQSISGTGGCRLAGEFIHKFFGNRTIYVPTPTWGNHIAIFQNAGLKPAYYPYYDDKKSAVDFNALLNFINTTENNSVFLLHACAHNPTGCDLSHEQWDQLSAAIKKKHHIVFLDSAYQGFASGNPEHDAYAIRKFVEDGHQILLSQSYAKNFGLYGERVGLLSVVTSSKEEAERVNSQLKVIVRPMYSNPPIHGARIVAEVLSDPQLKAQWLLECKGMADRITEMRNLLRTKLEAGNSGRKWNHITEQIGMFCYTGLSKEQVARLQKEYHIYCTEDGRFSMAGINSKNIDYLASSVLAVL
eukprot:gene6542-7043_t